MPTPRVTIRNAAEAWTRLAEAIAANPSDGPLVNAYRLPSPWRGPCQRVWRSVSGIDPFTSGALRDASTADAEILACLWLAEEARDEARLRPARRRPRR
jgi:hypothetical protein